MVCYHGFKIIYKLITDTLEREWAPVLGVTPVHVDGSGDPKIRHFPTKSGMQAYFKGTPTSRIQLLPDSSIPD